MPDTISHFHNLTLPDSVTTVLLDLDNTCYHYDPCHEVAITALKVALEEIVGPLSDFSSLYAEAQTRVKTRIPHHGASHSRLLYVQALFELLGRTDGHSHVIQLEDIYWQTFMDRMVLSPGLDTFLAECQKSAKKVVVVSDLTTAIQCQKLAKLHLQHLINFLVTSEEAGAEKPDPKPFLLALEKVGATVSDAVMIGDSQRNDISGASALGIKTILFTHESPTEQTTIR